SLQLPSASAAAGRAIAAAGQAGRIRAELNERGRNDTGSERLAARGGARGAVIEGCAAAGKLPKFARRRGSLYHLEPDAPVETTGSMASPIRIEALTRTYAGNARPAVDHLDLHVGRGEVVSLVGPSGCGKSTTLRMVAGLETPDSGSIRIGDRDVAGGPPPQ